MLLARRNKKQLNYLIFETNSSLEEKPEIINEDPLDSGWLYKIIIKNKDELKNLMSEEEYKKLIGV